MLDYQSVLAMNAAIGCTEHKCFAPIPGRVITDSEPKICCAPKTEANDHAVA